LISLEEWTTIKYLKAQGLGTRKIARQLGVSRNKVRRALGWDKQPKYERPARENPRLEPLRESILRMLVTDHFIGSRILKEIRQLGYCGSHTAFYNYLAKIKAEEGKTKACIRYETAPGQQAQYDWSPYTLSIGGVLAKVIIFRLVLGFSRRQCHFPSLNENQYSIYEGLEYGLQKFGGSPSKLLVDNAKAFVIKANPAHFQWNSRFLELCGHYSIQPLACRVRNPRSKGKVEKPFFYLEQHFIKGRSFESWEHFCRELSRFDEELEMQVHQTTQEKPLERFEMERTYLHPLPPGRFISSNEVFRHVSWDSLISFEGSRFSLPTDYAGKNVWIRTSQGRYLDIYAQDGNLICRHSLSQRKGATVLVEEHYAKLRRNQSRTRIMLEKEFLERFPDQKDFLEKLYIQQKLNPVFHLKPVLELAAVYPVESVLKAFDLARQYNTYSCHFIRGLLEMENPLEIVPEPRASTLWKYPVIRVKPDLESYQKLMEVNI
jgi:transposase